MPLSSLLFSSPPLSIPPTSSSPSPTLFHFYILSLTLSHFQSHLNVGHTSILSYTNEGAWAGKLVEVLKSGIQRPAAIAALPVVPKKRCIFSIHCPKVQVKSSCSTDYNGEHRGKGGNGWASHMWQEYEHGYPPPPHTCPLVIGPQGVYFRPEGQGGKYIAGVSPSESEVRWL